MIKSTSVEIVPASVVLGTGGNLSWNLGPTTTYTTGTPLEFTLRVINPTAEEKWYWILGALVRDTQVIHHFALRKTDEFWEPSWPEVTVFKLDPGAEAILSCRLVLPETDALLVLNAKEMVGNVPRTEDPTTGVVMTRLQAPAPIWTAVIPVVGMVMVVGMMVPLIRAMRERMRFE